MENPVSQLKAVPSLETGTAVPPVSSPMDERQLAQWELMTDQLLNRGQVRPWHVRHARKLIGAVAVLVAASLAFFSYYAWRLHTKPAVPAAPLPVTALPQSAPVPAAAVAPALAPASPAAPAPARATVPARSAAPIVPTTTSPRVPPVTHTLRDEPAPKPAAAVAAAAPAATVPPVAAPGDCPDAIVALGLCASHARKGMK